MNLIDLPSGQNPQPLSIAEAAAHERALVRSRMRVRCDISLLESMMEVDQLRLYLKFRLNSTYAYAREVMKLSEDVAVNFIRIARKCREVPRLFANIEAGKVTLSNARVIVPVLTNETAEHWLEKAKDLSKAELEKAVVRVKPSEAVRTSVKPVAEGQYKLEIGLPEALLEALKRCQDLCCQSQQTHVDLVGTLEELTRFYLERKDPVEKAKRARGIRPGADGGPPARPRGRAPLSAAARHAVVRRDRGRCQARNPDGSRCDSSRWTEIHHLREVQHGGSNEPANLLTLCAHHHRLHHRSRDGT